MTSIKSRPTQRSLVKPILRIHIHTSSQVLFDGFDVPFSGSFVNTWPTPHQHHGRDDCDELLFHIEKTVTPLSVVFKAFLTVAATTHFEVAECPYFATRIFEGRIVFSSSFWVTKRQRTVNETDDLGGKKSRNPRLTFKTGGFEWWVGWDSNSQPTA